MAGYSGGTAETDIAQFRRMVAESGTATYSDVVLQEIIARYPLPDITGEWPYLHSGSANTNWTPTYDLANAASSVWEEKASAVSGNFDFTADGATYHKAQQYKHYTDNARRWHSRRAPGNHTVLVSPSSDIEDSWIGNLPEEE